VTPPVEVKKTPQVKDSLTLKEFVQWLLKDGKDRNLVPGKRAALLDLPEDGVPTKAWGTGRSNPFHSCSLIIDKDSDTKKPRPLCIVIAKEHHHPEQQQSEGWEFRFRTDGSLERALSYSAQIDSEGKPVLGSAVNTSQDVTAPDVQAKAREELNFWLAKSYELTHKTAAKAEAAPAAAKSE
jgi:hypothetical protein